MPCDEQPYLGLPLICSRFYISTSKSQLPLTPWRTVAGPNATEETARTASTAILVRQHCVSDAKTAPNHFGVDACGQILRGGENCRFPVAYTGARACKQRKKSVLQQACSVKKEIDKCYWNACREYRYHIVVNGQRSLSSYCEARK